MLAGRRILQRTQLSHPKPAHQQEGKDKAEPNRGERGEEQIDPGQKGKKIGKPPGEPGRPLPEPRG